VKALHHSAWITLLFCSATFSSPRYYVSGNLGIFDATFNSSYLDQTDVIPQNIAQSISQNGYTGGVALGLRQATCDRRFYYGGELLLNYDSQNAVFQSGAATAAFSDKTRIQYHADLTFVPGMMLSQTVSSYLKLGLSIASIQDNLVSPEGYTPANTSTHSSKNPLGFAAGLGVATCITNNFSIFTEANYHDYGTVTFSNFTNFMAEYTHKSHVYSYSLVVGASYFFA